MTGILIDPTGKEIKRLEIASNGIGAFTEERFKIPTDGKVGLWKINIASGSNYESVEFTVFSILKEGIIIKAVQDKDIPGYGDNIKISITTSHKTSIIIEITNEENEIVEKMNCNTTKEFKCETYWTIPEDTIPGKYTIKAYDSINSAETTYLLK